MVKIETKEVYSEVYEVLNFLGKEYIDKLPFDLFNMLKEKRDKDYTPWYDENLPLAKQNIKKEALAIIALLHLNYWCENEREKEEIKKILKDNEDKYQEELRKKYNPDDIFKKHISISNTVKEETALVVYKESIFKKIINKIKRVFNLK